MIRASAQADRNSAAVNTRSFSSTNDTPITIAAALASVINADISIGVTASSSNGTLYMLSMAYSSGANYPLMVTIPTAHRSR